MTAEVSLLVSAEQGKGVNAAGDLFGLACAKLGLHVFQNIEYHSNIMGRNSYYRVIGSAKPIHSHHDRSDIVIALGGDAIALHISKVAKGGAFVYNSEDTRKHFESQEDIDAALKRASNSRDIRAYPLPCNTEIRKLSTASSLHPALLEKLANTMLVGAAFAILNGKLDTVNEAITHAFRLKPKVIPGNLEAAKLGFEHIRQHFPQPFPIAFPKAERPKQRYLLKGTDATALGIVNAGCGFFGYYPITPASDVADLLAELIPKTGMLVEQFEDEIASCCAVIGAGAAGARAMTATSGPGFDLKTEALGLAIMNEVPIVVGLFQRPGPSTGLPTRGDQSDLLLALFASHGAGSRIVLMPGDAEEAFHMVQDAFNHAERFQMPVVYLSDKHVVNSTATLNSLDFLKVKHDRGKLAKPDPKAKVFLRYKDVADGISPRTLPGMEGGAFYSASVEHDETGNTDETAVTRVLQMQKRFRKMRTVAKEIPGAKRVALHGPKKAALSVVFWGGTKGPVLDAMEVLREQGIALNALQVLYASPFPAKEVLAFLKSSRDAVIIEENMLPVELESGAVEERGQMELLIKAMTGFVFRKRVLKYNGRPLSREEVSDALLRARKAKSITVTGDRE